MNAPPIWAEFPLLRSPEKTKRWPPRAAAATKNSPSRLVTLTPLDFVLLRAVTAVPTEGMAIASPPRPW